MHAMCLFILKAPDNTHSHTGALYQFSTWRVKRSLYRHVLKPVFQTYKSKLKALSTFPPFPNPISHASSSVRASLSRSVFLWICDLNSRASQMALRIVYGVVFLSFSCACIKLVHLMLHPIFYFTS